MLQEAGLVGDRDREKAPWEPGLSMAPAQGGREGVGRSSSIVMLSSEARASVDVSWVVCACVCVRVCAPGTELKVFTLS